MNPACPPAGHVYGVEQEPPVDLQSDTEMQQDSDSAVVDDVASEEVVGSVDDTVTCSTETEMVTLSGTEEDVCCDSSAAAESPTVSQPKTGELLWPS